MSNFHTPNIYVGLKFYLEFSRTNRLPYERTKLVAEDEKSKLVPYQVYEVGSVMVLVFVYRPYRIEIFKLIIILINFISCQDLSH